MGFYEETHRVLAYLNSTSWGKSNKTIKLERSRVARRSRTPRVTRTPRVAGKAGVTSKVSFRASKPLKNYSPEFTDRTRKKTGDSTCVYGTGRIDAVNGCKVLERNFQNSFMRLGHVLHGWNISFCNFIIHKVLSQLLQATSISAIHVQSTQSIVLKVPLE